MNHRLLLACLASSCLTVVACGDDEDVTTSATGTTSSSTTSGSGGGATSSSATSGSGGMGAGGMGAGGGGPMVHGCTKATAQSFKGMATVDVGAVMDWDFGHQACLLVDVGTTVTWTGDLNLHPPVGGANTIMEPSSPISMAPIVMGNPDDTKTVTFDQAGDYPYFCQTHPSMVGVVYVE